MQPRQIQSDFGDDARTRLHRRGLDLPPKPDCRDVYRYFSALFDMKEQAFGSQRKVPKQPRLIISGTIGKLDEPVRPRRGGLLGASPVKAVFLAAPKILHSGSEARNLETREESRI